MMFGAQTNWLALLACGVFYMVVGMLWYGPLFAQPWMKLIGKTKKDIEREMKKGSMPKTYATSFILSLITAYVINMLIQLTNITDVGSAVMLGLMVWLGFVAAPNGTLVLYENRPVKLFAINAGYYLVTILGSAVILTLWP